MSRFLAALNNSNLCRPPVWLMRQAGRYLPEYKALRKHHSLLKMFLTPELIAEVTLMPIQRFGMDASILFSDILMIAKGMGLKLDFENGPTVEPYVSRQSWQRLDWDIKQMDPVLEGIRKIKAISSTPLIGFCGGPFTVSTYLISEEERSVWMEDGQFSSFLDRLTDHSIDYLKAQISAGVDVIQIFDSWACLLDDTQWEKWSLRPLQKIVQAIGVPVIIFMRGSSKRAERIAQIHPAAISLDWERPIQEVRKKISLPLQGNLDPAVLLRPINEVRIAAKEILDSMRQDPGFIFNLGHGVLPTTPVEAVEALFETVAGN